MLSLLFYIFLSFFWGRKNPLFYLIVVFALQQGPAAFIDQSITIAGKNIFFVSDQIFVDFLFFTTVGLALFFIKARLPATGYGGSKLIGFYLLYILFLFVTSLATYYDSVEVFLSGRQLFYVSLSFFLWISIFHAVTREQYEEFLKMLFYVTPISAVLYILNSSGRVTLFDTNFIYQELDGTSGTFFRDFATIPIQLAPVLVLSLLSLLTPTFNVPKWLLVINVVILPVALLFTFTRSMLVGILIQLTVLLLLQSLANTGKMIRQLFILIMVVALLFVPTYFLAAKFYPDAINYFSERITDAAVEKENDQNVDIRLAYLNKAIDITNETSMITGAGLNRKYYPQLDAIGAWIADSTLPFLLYHTGWLGIILLYLILLYFFIDSIRFYRRTNDWLVVFLSSGIITNTFSSLLMGGGMFTGSVWTFMNLALYSTIRLNLWKRNEVKAGMFLPAAPLL